MDSKPVTTAPTLNLEAEIIVATDRLKDTVGKSDVMEQCLKSMTHAGMAVPSSIEASKLVQVYNFALEREPAAALRKIVTQLIRGEIERDTPGIMPTPPELALMVRRASKAMHDDLVRARELDKARRENVARGSLRADIPTKQRLRTVELEQNGYRLVHRCTADEFRVLVKQKEMPIGAMHLFAIDEVWAPTQATTSIAERASSRLRKRDE